MPNKLSVTAGGAHRVGKKAYLSVNVKHRKVKKMYLTTGGVHRLCYRAEVTLTFTLSPTSATVVLKDSDGNTIQAVSSGVYSVPEGTYSYTASASGYVTKTGTVPVADEDVSVSVTLSANTPPLYTITVTAGTNGTITRKAISASAGSSMYVTAKPNDGYKVYGVSIKTASGASVSYTSSTDASGNMTCSFTMPAENVYAYATFVVDE